MHHLELQGVSKAFGTVQAVRELSFTVPRGAIYGFLGPNGAGKTTTIRMIMRIVLPDQGTILLDGEPVDDRRRELIGYLPEERGLYRKMHVLEHLAFLGEVRGLDRQEARARATAWLERLGLAEKGKAKVEALSKGMQQKVQFAAAVIHDPQLVILDEPFTGLDPIATRQFKDEILAMGKRGVTVVFSTHVLPQAEELCTHLCLINRGRALFHGPMEEVRRRYVRPQLKVVTADGHPPPSGLPGVHQVEPRNGHFLLHLDGTQPSHRVLAEVASRCAVAAIEEFQPNLEEIFLRAVEEDHVSLA
ncbi:MAG: ATP-binding cassette domain-containing protein [Thermoanaerobaculum sp.]|nr:ATP-binding cassette domain-containing protein [Thermoanaerobaculum sp.]MDW7968097.1 ATP-binding cassette domain-containing protein [Thermoanaerobaculum sp.]